MLQRLANESWSIEYLAAHLDAARTPRVVKSASWPANISKSDKSSEPALRLMVTYHHNVDNLVGWDNPSSNAYKAASKVIDWMPAMAGLINP
jgi:hypothetical protein